MTKLSKADLTVIGMHEALAVIQRAGWDQVRDANGEKFLVEDIDPTPHPEDTDQYVIDGDAVVHMHNGLRAETIWTRADTRAYGDLWRALGALEEGMEDLPEAATDAEAYLRVELANALAAADRILKVLAADEGRP